MLHIVGYIGAILIGVSMGLIGGGGTILTIPVLVYIFGIQRGELASGYSMFIVGTASLFGTIAYLRRKMFDIEITAVFGLPALLMVVITRLLLLPAIPAVIMIVGRYTLTKEALLMVLFALVMVFAAWVMLNNTDYAKVKPQNDTKWKMYLELMLQGGFIGFLSGLLGAGGGFLIVPALVSFSGLEMRKAVGTSLLIIAVNLLFGFIITELVKPTTLNWSFMLIFTALAVVGIMFGSYLAKYIPGKKLKPAFGIFILVMGLYILGKELF